MFAFLDKYLILIIVGVSLAVIGALGLQNYRLNGKLEKANQEKEEVRKANETLEARNDVLRDVNSTCTRAVETQNQAIQAIREERKLATDMWNVAVTEARQRSVQIQTRIERIREIKEPPPDQVCAVMMQMVESYVAGRKQ